MNRFKKYQDDKVSARKEVIREYLRTLEKSKIRFDHITQLSEVVAAFVQEVQKAPCSSTTVTRNISYRSLLENFMRLPAGGGLRVNEEKQVEEIRNDVRLISADLENSALQAEVKRLKNFISKMHAVSGNSENTLRATEIESELARLQEKSRELDYELGLTCKAIDKLLEKGELYFEVDHVARIIVDRAIKRGPERTIVNEQLSRSYFRWLENRGDLNEENIK